MNKRINWHKLLMFLCVLPILFVVFRLSNGSLDKNFNSGNLLWFGMLLLCPLMHLFMMRGMNHGNSCHQEDDKTEDQQTSPK